MKIEFTDDWYLAYLFSYDKCMLKLKEIYVFCCYPMTSWLICDIYIIVLKVIF